MTRKPLSFLVGAAVLMIAAQALSQDAPGRVLQKTNLRAVTPFPPFSLPVTLGPSFVLLLTPTVVTCPGSSTCTLHIEVSSQINSLDAGASADFRVEVGTMVATPGFGILRVATNNGTGATGVNSETFQFIKTGVTPGNHTVRWLARVTSGTATAINRIQKISIYTP
jgi:hypothetical protein